MIFLKRTKATCKNSSKLSSISPYTHKGLLLLQYIFISLFKGSEEAEATSLEAVDTESVPPSSVPEIELIIKASTIDGRRKGACIFCQEYFMDLYLLAEIKAISLKITTVDMKRPPVDFR